MAASYTIKLEIAGLDDLKRATEQISKLRIPRGGAGGNGAGGGGGGGARRGGGGFDPDKTQSFRPDLGNLGVGGPHQRFIRARMAHLRAQAQGNAPAAADALLAMQRAQGQIARARTGGGAAAGRGGLAGIVNQLFQGGPGSLLGGGGRGGIGALGRAAGPAGVALLVVEAATRALRKFSEAVARTTETVNALGQAGRVSGGSPADISFLSALGIQPGEIGPMSRQLRESITGGGFGRLAATKLGIGPILPRELGGPNEAELLRKTIQALAKDEEMLIRARQLGMDALVEEAQLYKRFGATIEADKKARETLFGPESLQDAQAAAFQFRRLQESLQLLSSAIYTPALRGAAILMGRIADGINAFTKHLFAFLQGLQKWISSTAKGLGLNVQFDADWMKDPLNQIAQNTSATAQNTAALKQGTFGGGPRAQRALPAGVRGDLLNRAVAADAMRLGAYALF